MPEKPHRKTRQRRVILGELRGVESHPTATEMYGLVRKTLPNVSLGTVYRNLEIFAQNGVIRKLESTGAEARFDGNIERHHHVRCVGCGRVADVHDVPESPIPDEVRKSTDYDVLGYRLEFTGVCPECRSKQKGKET